VDRLAGQDGVLGFLPIGGSKRESPRRRPVCPVCPLASWPNEKKAAGSSSPLAEPGSRAFPGTKNPRGKTNVYRKVKRQHE
jgi:hypothetical protein